MKILRSPKTSIPDYLLAQAKEKVAQLQRDYQQMQQEELHLQEEIKRLNDERREFITKARNECMSDEEFTPQIRALYDKELGVKRRLIAIEPAEDDFTKLDLEEQVRNCDPMKTNLWYIRRFPSHRAKHC